MPKGCTLHETKAFFTTCYVHFSEAHMAGDKNRKPSLNYTLIVKSQLRKSRYLPPCN